jgi:hypothetical protein
MEGAAGCSGARSFCNGDKSTTYDVQRMERQSAKHKNRVLEQLPKPKRSKLCNGIEEEKTKNEEKLAPARFAASALPPCRPAVVWWSLRGIRAKKKAGGASVPATVGDAEAQRQPEGANACAGEGLRGRAPIRSTENGERHQQMDGAGTGHSLRLVQTSTRSLEMICFRAKFRCKVSVLRAARTTRTTADKNSWHRYWPFQPEVQLWCNRLGLH